MRYLLCIVPPLAVLSCGKPGQFLLSCGLTMLFWVPGVIHALGVVSNFYADRRTDRIVRAIKETNADKLIVQSIGANNGTDTRPIPALPLDTSKGNRTMRLVLYGGILVFVFVMTAGSLFVFLIVASPNGDLSHKSLTQTGKLASVEEPKAMPSAVPKPDYVLPAYTVISISKSADPTIWRNVRVRLQERVSEDDLKKISENIKSAEAKKFIRTSLLFYLPEQEVDSQQWAMAQIDSKYRDKLDPTAKPKIEFFGNPKGTVPPKPEGEIVGQWDAAGGPHFYTLHRTHDGLKMNRTSNNETAFDDFVTAKVEGNRVIIRLIKDNGFGEYWILNEAKNLLLMDAEGIDKTIEIATAIIKPTLKS
jgi:uncharacterized membrane protein YqaE (UPF0057 family)